MTPQDDEKIWRDRLIAVNLLRIGSTLVVLLGLAIWYTDLLVEGGSMAIGLPLALVALAASFQGPKYLERKWRNPPGR